MKKRNHLTLSQYDKIDAALKQARNDVDRLRKIVARRSDPDDLTLMMLADFWDQFEMSRYALAKRREREYSIKEIATRAFARGGVELREITPEQLLTRAMGMSD